MTAFSARRLPVNQGPAAWAEILGPGRRYPQLAEDLTADIVVIGAGFAGLSAARRILQVEPKARVIIIEASEVAEGAAGRNSGFMIDLPHELTSADYAGGDHDKIQIAMNRHAIAFAREAVAEWDIDPNFFDPAGKINGAASAAADRANQGYARHLDALGEHHETLDAQQMTEVSGSRHYTSGLYTPGTVMLQPAGYIRGLAAGLAGADATIFERSAVTGFERVGSDWKVQALRGTVTAPKVILANNGHLESFGVARGRLMHVFLFASMTEGLDSAARSELGGQDRWGITPSDPLGTTVRRIDTGQGGHRIIIRTRARLRSNMTVTRRDVARAAQIHRQKFDDRFPQLAGITMEHSWAGHLCLSRNGVSVTKELETGLFSACVQNGLGTARGTLTGIAAAELALGEASEITTHFSSEGRPSKLPPSPLREIGANTYLRWKERKAASE